MASPPMWLPVEGDEDVCVLVPSSTWHYLRDLRAEIDAALEDLEDGDE